MFRSCLETLSFAPKVQKEDSQWQAKRRLWSKGDKNSRSEGAPQPSAASSTREPPSLCRFAAHKEFANIFLPRLYPFFRGENTLIKSSLLSRFRFFNVSEKADIEKINW
jgi:hypothetical protein